MHASIETTAAARATSVPPVRDRLVPSFPGSRFWGWAAPVLVTVFAGFLRFDRLSSPHAIVFDETYYVPDAYGILKHGVEMNAIDSAKNRNVVDHLLAHGGTHILASTGEYVAHPPLGKVMIAFGLLVIDRDLARTRIADAAPIVAEYPGEATASGGPKLGICWLRVLAGVCLGLACATKWNAVWYVPAFGALMIAWDYGARRAAGFGYSWYGALRSDVKWLPVWCAAVPAAAYTACWTGWFATSDGYDRDGTALNGGHHASTIVAWYQYSKSMLRYGLGLNVYHPYRSNPLGWLVLARPISLYTTGLPLANCCKPNLIVSEVLAIGTPLLWWGGAVALVACLLWWILRRDWRAGAVLVGVAAGWLPWIWFYFHDDRTEFYYYAVVFDPFIVIAIALCLGAIMGRVHAGPGRRATGAVLGGIYLLAVLANFAYLYPILTAEPIRYSTWAARMWFHSWI